MASGLEYRLRRILPSEFVFVLAIDDSLISGPTGHLADISGLIGQVSRGHCSAVLGFPFSMHRWLPASGPARIVNLTASTSLHLDGLKKYQIATVQEAIRHGADAVAAHINFSSDFEDEQVSCAARIAEEAHLFGLPVLVIAYLRNQRLADKQRLDSMTAPNADQISHIARAAVEIGADVVKIPNLSDEESLTRIANLVAPVPVLIAGGQLTDFSSFEIAIRTAQRAGIRGMILGRNVHQSSDIDRRVAAIGQIVERIRN